MSAFRLVLHGPWYLSSVGTLDKHKVMLCIPAYPTRPGCNASLLASQLLPRSLCELARVTGKSGSKFCDSHG